MGVFWENIIMAADALAPYMCVVLPGAQRVLINVTSLQWRHSEHDGVSNHQPHDCLLNRLFRRRSKKTSKFRVTGLCEGNSPVTGEFPPQRVSNTKNVSIWWRHHSTGQNIIGIWLISQFYFVISDKAFHKIIQVTHKRQQCVSGTALYIKSCETVAEDKR